MSGRENQCSPVQALSHVQPFVIPWTSACQASLSITKSWSYSNSCPLSRWYHPTISSSVIPFSSCLQTFPASWSVQMSQFFASGSQSIGVSALTSVLLINIQDRSPLEWTGWISLQSKGLFKSLPQHHSSKALILQLSAFFIVQLSHPYMTTGKTIDREIVKLFSRVRLFATPWTVANQAPPSMKFSRQEYWSGLWFPSPGDLPNPGIEPRSPAL